jgi:hypothetical protein
VGSKNAGERCLLVVAVCRLVAATTRDCRRASADRAERSWLVSEAWMDVIDDWIEVTDDVHRSHR